jgi:hypothetical protein
MDNVYTTDDTYFSAVLIAMGYPLQDTEVVVEANGFKKVMFFFDNSGGEIEGIFKRYDYSNLPLDSKTVAMAIKDQKKRVATILREAGQ